MKNFRKKISLNFYSIDEFTKKFYSEDLDYEPATNFSCSNSSYFILGNLIEKVTNQNYAAVLTEKILNPLGMNNAGYDTSSGILKNRAYGYERQLNGYINTDYLDMSMPYSAGGYVFNCQGSGYLG
ncbi:hypothetical protein CJF42_22995 [Pseudoalteromonas sp. NBT06-2]|nr:hypothetical protein CJF42_22995 [Pseudoalteromonas sp. NBT06-2]